MSDTDWTMYVNHSQPSYCLAGLVKVGAVYIQVATYPMSKRSEVCM
jgi:hypothetical protein